MNKAVSFVSETALLIKGDNMRHKKLIVLSFFVAFAAALLCSCTFPPEYVSKSDTEKEILTLMELINSEDKEQLFDHFSDYIKENYEENTKSQIDKLFSAIEGKIVSHDNPKSLGYSHETVNSGDITLYHSSPDVLNVITEGGQNLSFQFSYRVIDDEFPENVGITQIVIFNKTEDSYYGDVVAEVGGEYKIKEQ